MGSILGACQSKGEFKSVVQIIIEMSPAQKQALFNALVVLLNKMNVKNMASLLLVANTAEGKNMIVVEVGKFLKNQMNMLMSS